MTKPPTSRRLRQATARQLLGRNRARRLIKELNALHEIGRAISRSLHLSDILETIYGQTSRLMDTRYCYIALHHPEQNHMEFALAMEDGNRVYWPSRPWGAGLTEWLLEHRQPLRLCADTLDPRIAAVVIGWEPLSFLGAEPAAS